MRDGSRCHPAAAPGVSASHVLVQARAAGVVGGDLAALRALVRQTQRIVRYEPGGDAAAWQAAEQRAGV